MGYPSTPLLPPLRWRSRCHAAVPGEMPGGDGRGHEMASPKSKSMGHVRFIWDLNGYGIYMGFIWIWDLCEIFKVYVGFMIRPHCWGLQITTSPVVSTGANWPACCKQWPPSARQLSMSSLSSVQNTWCCSQILVLAKIGVWRNYGFGLCVCASGCIAFTFL